MTYISRSLETQLQSRNIAIHALGLWLNWVLYCTHRIARKGEHESDERK